MKRIFTFGMVAVMAASTAFADEPSVTELDGGMYYQGYMPLAISPNGKYVSGSTYLYPAFTSVWQEQKNKVYLEADGSVFENYGGELRGINNQGIAVGFDDLGPMIVNAIEEKIEHIPFNNPDANFSDVYVLNDINDDPDLQIIVGQVKLIKSGDPKIVSQACYWENGVPHLLPQPASNNEFAGNNDPEKVYFYGSTALRVSSDGKVIMGNLIDRMYTNPMVFWVRQDDGTYEYFGAYEEYWSDQRDVDQKPYLRFKAEAMSPDGYTIAVTLKPNYYGTEITTVNQLGLYDVGSGKLVKIVETDGTNNIPAGQTLELFYGAVSNSRTVVGSVYTKSGSLSPFILHFDDEQPTLFMDAFDTIDLFADMNEAKNGGDNKVSAISADARYITGCGWMLDSRFNIGYYHGYVLDTGVSEEPYVPSELPGSGVGKVALEEAGDPVYYNISGQRLNAPVKGINIIRYPNGKVEKVIR